MTLLWILVVLAVILIAGSLIYGLVARPSMRQAAERRRIAEAESRRSPETPLGPH
jgi:peptidoglycan/LPS O-acetylase OafA/YrhL